MASRVFAVLADARVSVNDLSLSPPEGMSLRRHCSALGGMVTLLGVRYDRGAPVFFKVRG